MNSPATDPIRALVVLGTRPEAVKMLPVIRALGAEPQVELRTVFTGQHKEMVEQILGPFGIRPDANLEIMRANQTLNQIVQRVMQSIDDVYDQFDPQIVLVQGDTTSAFVAGLAAFQRRIKVAHVEAGLRSGNRFHPYPEESNRRMLSSITDLHFAPTETSADNLLREGVEREDVVITGNTTVDALLTVLSSDELQQAFDTKLTAALAKPMVLITLHRRESWVEQITTADGRSMTVLEQIFHGVREAAERHADHSFVYPVHANPKVREPAEAILGGVDNVLLTDAQPYFPFVQLMARARAILSDSGGIQEEAPTLGVPVLVLRKTTERPEGVASGNNRLVGTDPGDLVRELGEALAARGSAENSWPHPNPFGDGRAAERIRDAILHRFQRGPRAEEFEYAASPQR